MGPARPANACLSSMPDVLQGHPNPAAYTVPGARPPGSLPLCRAGERAASARRAPRGRNRARPLAGAPRRWQQSTEGAASRHRQACRVGRAPLLGVLGRARVLQRLGPVEGDGVARLALLLPRALLHRLGRLLRRGLGILACAARAAPVGAPRSALQQVVTTGALPRHGVRCAPSSPPDLQGALESCKVGAVGSPRTQQQARRAQNWL